LLFDHDLFQLRYGGIVGFLALAKLLFNDSIKETEVEIKIILLHLSFSQRNSKENGWLDFVLAQNLVFKGSFLHFYVLAD